MTFKQLLRKLFAELWHRCAKLAEAKFGSTVISTGSAEWWEAFILRCEKRALYHAQFVPTIGEYRGAEPERVAAEQNQSQEKG